MKMHILAVSAIAMLCATGAAVAQDEAAAGSSTLCSTLNGLTGDAQQAFLQGYQAGMVDAMLAGASEASATESQAAATPKAPAIDAGKQKIANGEANNNAGAVVASAGEQSQTAATTEPALNAGAQKIANGEANNNKAAVAADMGVNIDWNPIISGCAGAPDSTISSLRAGSAGAASK
jgi:hypothetical protein